MRGQTPSLPDRCPTGKGLHYAAKDSTLLARSTGTPGYGVSENDFNFAKHKDFC